LFERRAAPFGVIGIVEAGAGEPAGGDLLEAVGRLDADEALVLPNSAAGRRAAERVAERAERVVEVVPSESLPAGLAALAAYDGARSAAANARAMAAAAAAVSTGALMHAAREPGCVPSSLRGDTWLGLAGGEPVAWGSDPAAVALAVVDRLLAQPRRLLTILAGAQAPPLGALLHGLAAAHPGLELAVHEGGQPHYHLLLGAE
jgi:dihydroxyacetone kinase-like predicted kinase